MLFRSRLGKPGDKVTVSGMRVNGGAETALPPHALRANILCKRHNEQLSALDGMSASFIDTLSGDPRRGAFVSNNGHLLRHFSGRAMEAWFLKVALGLLVSGNASFPAKPDSWKPPVALLRILFRGETFAVPLGLYTVDQPGNGHHFQAQLFGDEQGLSAMKCVLANVVFVLIMTADVRPFARSVYRPPEFFRRDLPPRIVRLIWDEPGANERIDIGF